MISDLLMNDTFDNFVFIPKNIEVSVPHKLHSSVNHNIRIDNIDIGSNAEEISFDDSIFLSGNCSGQETLPKSATKTNNSQKIHEINKTQKNVSVKKIEDKFCLQRQIKVKEKCISFAEINEENLKSDLCDLISDQYKKGSIIEPASPAKNKSNNCETKSNALDMMCKLSSWGLPESVLQKYDSKNLKFMFPWQVECLKNTEALTDSKNLVYSAPTSAGKTLIAEILAIKTVFECQKKVIFILPFVSIVREKMYYFQDLLGSSGIRVEGFMGSYNPPGGFSSVQIAICTIEKANNLINRLLEEEKISEIGAILVDEMHLLGDPGRGYLLELLLTKLRYISQKDNLKIQIIGMSATLPNLSTLAQWLNADLYTTEFRPVPLHEKVIVCGEIYDKHFTLIRKLTPLPELGTDTDNILQLCLETIKDSCSVLIFCPTKNWCENLALQISSAFFKIGMFLLVL